MKQKHLDLRVVDVLSCAIRKIVDEILLRHPTDVNFAKQGQRDRVLFGHAESTIRQLGYLWHRYAEHVSRSQSEPTTWSIRGLVDHSGFPEILQGSRITLESVIE